MLFFSFNISLLRIYVHVYIRITSLSFSILKNVLEIIAIICLKFYMTHTSKRNRKLVFSSASLH